jgi:uncharacterized protein (DUF2147 family)
MKILHLTFFFLLIVSSLKAQRPNDVIGVWESEERDFRLEFYRSGEKYNAKTLWGKRIVESNGRTSKKDTQNPDEKLRNRDIIGITSMTGLKWDEEESEYIDGIMYNPLDGKTYSGKVWLENGKLYLRAYFGVSLLGKTISFHRFIQ